ncbi:MAG: beta-N-acetylhexosaminidase [Xanthomonadales bacterium]|nr:beta-N-acetylhexosaminidase [Xanthomonadales bacterium]
MNTPLPPGPLLVGLPGTELDGADRDVLRHPATGGVVLFTRNFRSPAQVADLTAAIRAESGRALVIAVDHEGGRVQRFRDGFTRLPPLALIGRMAEDDPALAADLAYRHARVMATELLLHGVDLSFAPVLDLGGCSEVIGDRALGATPEQVIELGRSYLAGMHDAGMAATGKHFPGHGSVAPDSHVADVTDPRSLEDIRASDLRPFEALLDGLDAVMLAHVVYPAMDDCPAGYSSRWVRDFLRGELDYQGVVMSDDLGMHAARVAGGLRARLDATLKAGCDIALVCDPDDTRRLLDGLDGAPAPGDAVSRLAARSWPAREEIEQVPEWRQWRRSIEALGDPTWT